MLRDSSKALKISIIILLFGMLIIALWQLNRSYNIQKNGITQLATIEAYRQKLYNPQSINSKDLTYAPVFSFIANDNKKYTLTASYTKQKKYNLGDRVKVYYLKNQPKSATIEGHFPFKTYTILAIFGIFGIVMLTYNLKISSNRKS